jgi:hypothetical protein
MPRRILRIPGLRGVPRATAGQADQPPRPMPCHEDQKHAVTQPPGLTDDPRSNRRLAWAFRAPRCIAAETLTTRNAAQTEARVAIRVRAIGPPSPAGGLAVQPFGVCPRGHSLMLGQPPHSLPESFFLRCPRGSLPIPCNRHLVEVDHVVGRGIHRRITTSSPNPLRIGTLT